MPPKKGRKPAVSKNTEVEQKMELLDGAAQPTKKFKIGEADEGEEVAHAESEVTENKQKRGVGRPKREKNVTTKPEKTQPERLLKEDEQTNSDETEEVTTETGESDKKPKRGRGRPKTTAENVISKKETSRRVKQNDRITQDDSKQTENGTGQKKRGRPKKDKTSREDAINTQENGHSNETKSLSNGNAQVHLSIEHCKS